MLSLHFLTSKASFNGKIGWENMKKLMLQSFQEEGPRNYKGEKTDISIEVFSDAAYATFTEKYLIGLDAVPTIRTGINNAFFVKSDGEWKFVCMNIVNTSSFDDARKKRQLVQEYMEESSGKAKTVKMIKKYIEDQDLIDHIVTYESAFPEYELIPSEILVDGIRVTVYATFRGVHNGFLEDIPATGKSVELPVLLIYTVENERKQSVPVFPHPVSLLRVL